MRTLRSVARRVVGRRPAWFRTGDHVTFTETGFVAAPSPARLLARHNYETRSIRTVLDGVSVDRSLEVGCGYGRLSPTFAEHSRRHQAVDVNTDALTLARACYPHIEFLEGSATRLPFGDATFGLVATWTVLQHVPDDQLAAAANEISRVLERGGTILLCEATRFADRPSASSHVWDRSSQTYAGLFPSLTLKSYGQIEEVDAIPGVASPGEIMVLTSS